MKGKGQGEVKGYNGKRLEAGGGAGEGNIKPRERRGISAANR